MPLLTLFYAAYSIYIELACLIWDYRTRSCRYQHLSVCLYNLDITRAASMLAHFDWAVYGFNSGHIFSTIREHTLPFTVILACNPYVNGCSLFCEIDLPNCPWQHERIA
jgi:hypothetical protein